MERQTQGHQGGPRFPDGRGDQDMRKNDRRAIVQQVAAKSSTKSIFQQVAGKLKEQRIVQRSVGQLPQGYQEFLRDIKSRIQAARTKACLAVNRELILLYREIGNRILAQQRAEGWGTKVVGRLRICETCANPLVLPGGRRSSRNLSRRNWQENCQRQSKLSRSWP